MLQSDRCLNCVSKSLNLFKNCIVKDLDCEGFGLCKIWIMEDFDHVRFGSRNVKNVLILF